MAQIVPLVDEVTHILAIHGGTDTDPREDGFLADLALLNKLLQYQGHEQHWFGSIDLERAIQRYSPVIWGNERQNHRKMVLDVNEGLSLYRQYLPNQLKDAFLEKLRNICNNVQHDSHILILLIGHGEDPPHYGLWIGDHEGELTPLAPTPGYIFKHEVDVILADLRASVDVCILVSSCFSGGWVCSDKWRSAMVAKSASQKSMAFPRLVSGNNHGPHFVHAVVDAMQRSQLEQTRDNLYESFSLAHIHQTPVFTTQDEQWEAPMSRMTCLSSQRLYRRRFEALPSYPSTYDTTLATTQATGSRSRQLDVLISHYLSLRPGPDNAAHNISVHSHIHSYRTGIPHEIEPSDCAWLGIALRWRCLLASWVETMVQMLWLLPFPSFSSWDAYEWEKSRSHPYSQYEQNAIRAYEVISRFSILFPTSPRVENFTGHRSFGKIKQYLVAAVIARGIDQLEFHRRLATFLSLYSPEETEPSDVY